MIKVVWAIVSFCHNHNQSSLGFPRTILFSWMNFNLQFCYLSFLILITILQITLEATCKEFCIALASEKRIRPFSVVIIQSQGWKIHYHIPKPLSYVYIGWDISGISQLNYYIVFHLGFNVGEYLTSNHKEMRELWLFTIISFLI